MSQLVAVCGSYICTGILSSRLTKKDYVVKNVKNTNSCPDCSCALVWRKAGAFYDLENSDGVFSTNFDSCKVCAVGSILRAVKPGEKLSGELATGYNFLAGDLDQAYNRGTFLGKLSTEFEAAAIYEKEEPDSDDMRMFLLFLTEAFCPAVLEFEA